MRFFFPPRSCFGIIPILCLVLCLCLCLYCAVQCSAVQTCAVTLFLCLVMFAGRRWVFVRVYRLARLPGSDEAGRGPGVSKGGRGYAVGKFSGAQEGYRGTQQKNRTPERYCIRRGMACTIALTVLTFFSCFACSHSWVYRCFYAQVDCSIVICSIICLFVPIEVCCSYSNHAQ